MEQMIQSDQKVCRVGVACGEDIKGAGKSLVDTMFLEGGVGQDLRGGTCLEEEKVWGETMGVECLWGALGLKQG